MDEQLSVHQEERQVVHSPDDEEEARVVPQAVAYGYEEDSMLAMRQ